MAADEPVASELHGPAFRFGERAPVTTDVEATVIAEAPAHLLERHFPYTR